MRPQNGNPAMRPQNGNPQVQVSILYNNRLSVFNECTLSSLFTHFSRTVNYALCHVCKRHHYIIPGQVLNICVIHIYTGLFTSRDQSNEVMNCLKWSNLINIIHYLRSITEDSL